MEKKYYKLNLYGTEYDDLYVVKNTYMWGETKGRLALSLISTSEGPFCTLSVNLVDETLTNDKCFFVDTNNCPFAESFLIENKIAVPTGSFGFSGFCVYPEFELIDESL